MRLRLALATIVALLAIAAPASALTLNVPQNYALQSMVQQWADEAAQQVPTPNVSIRVRLQPCSKPDSMHAACVHAGRWGQIIDFPGPELALGQADPAYAGDMGLRVRFLFLHELGHVADLQPGRRPWRNAFRGVFGLRQTIRPIKDLGFRGLDPWAVSYTPGGEAVQTSEWFADAYAACALWPHEPPRQDYLDAMGHGYAPTSAQHDRACRVGRAMSFAH